MANLASSFIGALCFIYDMKNNFIARTVITGHNRAEMYIEVADGLDDVKPKTRFQLLIIHSGGASELKGSLKSVRQGIFEISIFGERQRDGRSAVRHTINASAVISDMVTDYEPEKLGEPIPVIVENLSTTGLLLKTKEKRFVLGSLLQIEVKLHGKNVILFGEVVREQEYPDEVYKYGCQLYFINKK